MDNGDGAAPPDRGDWRIPYDHVGDLFHEGEKPSVTIERMRAHLPIAFPTLHASMRFMRESHDIAIYIHRFGDVDLTDGTAAQRLRSRIDAELERFIRYEWWPNHGMRAVSLNTVLFMDLNGQQENVVGG